MHVFSTYLGLAWRAARADLETAVTACVDAGEGCGSLRSPGRWCGHESDAATVDRLADLWWGSHERTGSVTLSRECPCGACDGAFGGSLGSSAREAWLSEYCSPEAVQARCAAEESEEEEAA